MKRLYNFIFDDLLTSSWRTVVHLWKPMAGWTILVYLLVTALVSPILVYLLDWGIFRGERLVVGNEELLSWLISPSGLVYLFTFFTISLVGSVIRYAGLFQIITDHVTGQKVSVRETALHIAPRVHILLKLCAITVLGAVILLLPLLIGLGIVYLVYLTEFDANYYLLATPPEWYRALTIGGIWAGIWFIAALIMVACMLPGLPAYLDGRKSLKEAVREIWVTPLSQTLRFIKVIALASFTWVSFRLLVDASIAFIFFVIIDWVQLQFEGIRPLLFAAGGFIFTSLTVGTIINFFGFSMISTVITKFYYSFTKPDVTLHVPGFLKLTRKTLRILTWWTRPARAGALIVIILAGSIVSSILIASDHYSEGQIEIITHRANAPPAPENSLAALESSIALGADYAEIDVQLTADETAVILHDEDLMRVAGVPQRIAEVNYEDIRNLTLLTDAEIPDSLKRIPTLSDFIEASQDRIKLMIELKYYGFNPQLAQETVQLIRQYGVEEQVVVKSNNIQAVRQMRDLAPDLKLGYVFAVGVGDISRLPIDFLSVNQQYITPDLVQRAEQQNMKLYAWTVNQRESIISVVQKGVDGIITDFPERVIYIIEEINGLTRAERLLLQLGLLILEPPLEVDLETVETPQSG